MLMPILEWVGVAFALIGSATLAANRPWSRYGWWFYVVSNLALLVFALERELMGIATLQLAFLHINAFAIARCFERPLRSIFGQR